MSQPIQDSPRPIHFLIAFAVSVLLWLLLAGSLDKQEWVAAVAAGLLVTLLAAPRLGIFAGIRLTPMAPIYLVLYLGRFFAALIVANLDLARRVLTPSLPIRPALVEIGTKLQSPLGRMLLANSITLTPGTLVIDVCDDRLLVHWIDCPPGTDLEQATHAIASDFERYIEGFLK
ncbi:MAG TPA: cation:proton antiporter [Chromatiaceae bacterium]|jgi:multicomponent Na+:H+ antiporter subunit E|nr:MAG: Na+/H+ antiporter subunit E [Thiohalocapsa sp. PB-PSB1]HBG95944.1 cation:proton antiporter [Chromatiaceae bacterium]HCS90128.1 cation:proton antiporter [Chromatiaceae bacterium]